MLDIKSIFPLIEEISEKIKKQSQSLNGISDSDSSKEDKYNKNLQKISSLRGRPLFYPYISSGLGCGPFVKLLDGSVKLDFICGIGPHILGHSHPDLIKASLRGSLEDVVMQGHLQVGSIYQEVLDKLLNLAGKNSRLTKAWLCPSGSMANENALKVIRQKQKGAKKILAFENAFAGRTTLMSEVTDNPKVKEGLPSYEDVLRVPFCPDDPDRALKVLKKHYDEEGKNLACFMVELMQGDGGYRLAQREFFIPLFDFCKKKNIAIWVDEVQTFARSGEFFAFEKLRLGDYVDVCTIGKALQMSASLWTEEFNPKPGLVSGTFSSSSSSFYSALAVLNFLSSGYMGEEGKIHFIYKEWVKRLKKLEEENLLSGIEGWGLMVGATPLDGKLETINQLLPLLFKKGLMCFSCGSDESKRLRFLLPAIVEEVHLDQACNILKECLLLIKEKKGI